MAGILQFPTPLSIKTLDTSESYEICKFTLAGNEDQEIKHARILIYKHGTAGGSETLTLKIYGEAGSIGLIDTSSAVSLSLAGASGTYSLNWFRFDFNRKPLKRGLSYYAVIETANYTRNADTYYLGVVLQSQPEWMQNTNKNAVQMDAAVFHLYGYQ
jgi:hypothetical protein